MRPFGHGKIVQLDLLGLLVEVEVSGVGVEQGPDEIVCGCGLAAVVEGGCWVMGRVKNLYGVGVLWGFIG
jgi:hypothetical protein